MPLEKHDTRGRQLLDEAVGMDITGRTAVLDINTNNGLKLPCIVRTVRHCQANKKSEGHQNQSPDRLAMSLELIMRKEV